MKEQVILEENRTNQKKSNMMQLPQSVTSTSTTLVHTTSKSSVSPTISENQKFQTGGASIVYVHTFCAELLGEASSLELCRSEMRQKCDIDVLSWFKLSPSESQEMLGRSD